MNSRERFLAAQRGETPDRTPVAHVSALTTIELQDMTGCAISPRCPNVNFQAMVEAVQEWHGVSD